MRRYAMAPTLGILWLIFASVARAQFAAERDFFASTLALAARQTKGLYRAQKELFLLHDSSQDVTQIGLQLDASLTSLELDENTLFGSQPQNQSFADLSAWAGIGGYTIALVDFKNAVTTARSASDDTTRDSQLQDAVDKGEEFYKRANDLVNYVTVQLQTYLKDKDEDVPVQQVLTAIRQGQVLEQILLGVAKASLQFQEADTYEEMQANVDLFAQSHVGLLDGLRFVDLPATTNKCTLQGMGEVSDSWAPFNLLITQILFESTVRPETQSEVFSLYADLRQTLEQASNLYLFPTQSCATAIASNMWMNLIETASVQMMYAQKVGRLFFQAAKGINQLDSRVLMSDSVVGGGTALTLLRAGSGAAGVPPPVTTDVVALYNRMFNIWQVFSSELRENIQSVGPEDAILFASVASRSDLFYTTASEAMVQVVDLCVQESVGVRCVGLRVLGDMRVLLQKMGKESVLMALGQNFDANNVRILASAQQFQDYLELLIHGKVISRDDPDFGTLDEKVRNYCLLQDFKKVQDVFFSFRESVNNVSAGIVEEAATLDAMQWKAGVDPMNALITQVKSAYAVGGDCNLGTRNEVTRVELEQAIKAMGAVSLLVEQMAMRKMYEIKEASYPGDEMSAMISTFENDIYKLISGWLPFRIPAPVSQELTDDIFDMFYGETDGWSTLKDVLTEPSAQYYGAQNEKFMRLVKETRGRLATATDRYKSDAFTMDTDVPGARSVKVSETRFLVDRLCLEAAFVSANGLNSENILGETIQDFEANLVTLRNGNSKAPGSENFIPATIVEEAAHLDALSRVEQLWLEIDPDSSLTKSLRDFFQDVANEVAHPSTSDLSNLADDSRKIQEALDDCVALFSEMTVIVEKIPIKILVPVPMTGRWTGGETMKLTAEMIEYIINDEQEVLPGYLLDLEFLDDECDPDRANRIALERIARSDDWVGVGGMGCSDVCISLAVITSSLFLPTVSFDCSEGETLSDTTLFPDFVRMGTSRSASAEILVELKKSLPWWDEVTIISESALTEVSRAEAVQQNLARANLQSSLKAAAGDDYAAIRTMMSSIKEEKRRILFFVGSEYFFRRVMCAGEEEGLPTGATWLFEGVMSRNWWEVDDPRLPDQCQGEKVSSLLEDAIAIMGRGQTHDADAKLDCFAQHTVATLGEQISTDLVGGWPAPGGANVSRPYDQVVNFVIDGTCAFAMLVKHMIFDRGFGIEDLRTPEKSVYEKELQFMKQQMQFQGMVGTVQVQGNNVDGDLAVMQIKNSRFVEVGSYSLDGTIDVSNVNLDGWSAAPEDEEIEMSPDNWHNVLSQSTVVWVFAEKSARLFLQAAQGVNELDSRVLFSDARIHAEQSLAALQFGSDRFGIPSGWTQGQQALIDLYERMSAKWDEVSDFLASHIAGVKAEDTDEIARVATDIGDFTQMAANASDLVVQQCLKRSNEPCRVLYMLGKQRMLLQLIAKRSAFVGLNYMKAENMAAMIEEKNSFQETHHAIIHGIGENIKRTENHCTMQQMKDVQDAWDPYAEVVMKIIGGNTSSANILALDQMMWSAGIDPMFTTITKALDSFERGSGICSHVGINQAEREEFEAGLKSMGHFSTLLQKITAEHLFVTIGLVNIRDATDTVDQADLVLTRLLSGWTPDDIPAPPSQLVLDDLLAIVDGAVNMANSWQDFKNKLEVVTEGDGEAIVRDILDISKDVQGTAEDSLDVYVTAVVELDPNVPGLRSKLAGEQLALVERMVKQALMVFLSESNANSQLESSAEQFMQNHMLLLNGGELIGGRVVGPTTEDTHRTQMLRVLTEWEKPNGFQDLVTAIANQNSVDRTALSTLVSLKEELREPLEDTNNLYSTMTITTTKKRVNLMLPLPLSGDWLPGPTMEMAATVAVDEINGLQEMLPGYRIFMEVFDDECNADQANRAMLETFASNSDWVGVGGMACSSVCKSLAVITSSLFVPAISFECSEGMELSDTSLFPDFMRMGTNRRWLNGFLHHLKSTPQLSYWESITLVSASDAESVAQAVRRCQEMTNDGLQCNRRDASPDDWNSVLDLADILKLRKERFIFFTGSERFFRRMLCATMVREIPPGLTWISESAQSRDWWTVDDAELMELEPQCDGQHISDAYEGGVNFVGLAEARGDDAAKPLACFPEFNAVSLNEHIKEMLALGYPANHPNRSQTIVAQPYDTVINFALDGVCAFATMVAHMLFTEGYVIEQLRTPIQSVYRHSVDYLRNDLAFQGATGWVDFTDNDLLGYLTIDQNIGRKRRSAGLISPDGQMDLNVNMSSWRASPVDPITPMSTKNWKEVIELASTQIMYSEKMQRLFFQAARGVNQLDSRVLFSDSRVGGRARLENLLNGLTRNEEVLIPKKWFTDEVKALLESSLEKWMIIEKGLADRVQTISAEDTDFLALANNSIAEIVALGEQTLELTVIECLRRDPDTPCRTLQALGLQRARLQRIAKEAVVQSLLEEAELARTGGIVAGVVHRDRMFQIAEEYWETHLALVHGNDALPRTSDHCILQQMKKVQDDWANFAAYVDIAYAGDFGIETLTALDGKQWDAGVDPMFVAITSAIHSYQKGEGTCIQVGENNASQVQLETAMMRISDLGRLIEKVVTEYMFFVKGVGTRASILAAQDEFETRLYRIFRGWSPDRLPAPTSQEIVDALLLLEDGDPGARNGWVDVKEMIAELLDGGLGRPNAALEGGISLVRKWDIAVNHYIDSAWEINPAVPGARAKIAGKQAMYLQRMLKEAALMTVLTEPVEKAAAETRLRSTLTAFEKSFDILMNGGSARLLNEDRVVHALEESEEIHRSIIEASLARWETTKAVFLKFLDTGDVSLSALQNVTQATQNYDKDIKEVQELFATVSSTTTKVLVHLMVPLPLTGPWAPGPTMQRATEVATDLINEQQMLLPGYTIVNDYFDDQCNADLANRAMLANFASSQQWVGVAGMGCSSVCKSLAVIAASLFLPLVSFECSEGDELSDTSLFRDFNRLGTRRTMVPDILEHMYRMFDWDSVSIVAIEHSAFKIPALDLQSKLPDNIRTSFYSLGTGGWARSLEVMEEIRAAKGRAIFFFGSEAMYRQVICASHTAKTFPGLTWLSEGVQSRAWWTQDDSDVMNNNKECDGKLISDLYQGAINFAGMGAPFDDEAKDTPLDCFSGFTSRSMSDHLLKMMTSPYPVDDPNATTVETIHERLISLAVDGVCMFALNIKSMLEMGIAFKDLETPDQSVYTQVVQNFKNSISFNGVSGVVNLEGNDVPNNLIVWQVFANETRVSGFAETTGGINVSSEYGLSNATWAPAPADVVANAEEGFPILTVVIPALVIFFCGIVGYAFYVGRRRGRSAGSDQTTSNKAV